MLRMLSLHIACRVLPIAKRIHRECIINGHCYRFHWNASGSHLYILHSVPKDTKDAKDAKDSKGIQISALSCSLQFPDELAIMQIQIDSPDRIFAFSELPHHP